MSSAAKIARGIPEGRRRRLVQRSLMCPAEIEPSRNTPPTASQPCTRNSVGSQGLGPGPNCVCCAKPRCRTSHRHPLSHSVANVTKIARRTAGNIRGAEPLLIRAQGHVPESDEPAHTLRHVLARQARAGDVLDVCPKAHLFETLAARELAPPRLVADLPAVALPIGQHLERAQLAGGTDA